MKKKWLCMLGALVLALMMFAIPSQAAKADVEKWADVADISWYNTTDTTFTLTTAEQLAGLAQISIRSSERDSFVGKKIVLGADIYLTGKHWTPIGDRGIPFCGEFDGKGHTIFDLYIDGAKMTGNKAGLFGCMGTGGSGSGRHGGYLHDFTIKNTTFVNMSKDAAVVVGNIYHDCVLRNITVDTASLQGTNPGSAVVSGVANSHLENIFAKNIYIHDTNGGEIGGFFTNVQSEVNNCRTSYFVKDSWIPGTVYQSGGIDLVVSSYFKNCHIENVTIEVDKNPGYIGGFGSHGVDTLSWDAGFFENCSVTGLLIDIKSTSGTPRVGGFLGLRGCCCSYTFTNTEGQEITIGCFKDCYAEGVIKGQKGIFGGFAAESGIYSGYKPNSNVVTRVPGDAIFTNATADVDIIVTDGEKSTIGGFIGKADTKNRLGSGVAYSDPASQIYTNCKALGTIQIGDGEATGTTFIGQAITTDPNAAKPAGITLNGCYASGLDDLNEQTEENVLNVLMAQRSPDTALVNFQYAIAFDTDGGKPVPDTIIQELGTAVTAPAAPSKAGYIFKGWDQEIPETMPAGYLTIKALWEELPPPPPAPSITPAPSAPPVVPVPPTGDDTPVVLYAGLLCASVLGLCTVWMLNRKKERV